MYMYIPYIAITHDCTWTVYQLQCISCSQNETEATLMETNILMGEIVTALDNLQDWAAPKPQPRDLLNKFNLVYLQAEPFGVVLNISAWNFPFQLTLSPLIGAIAAGETIIKLN